MESSNIRNRSILIVIVAALLVWAYFQSGIRLGQDLRGGTTLRFSLDIEGAKKSGRIAQDADPAQVVDQTLKVIGERLDASGLAELGLVPYGEDKFLISLPAGAASQADAIIAVVSQLGDLKFRIQVLPDAEYQRRIETNYRDDPPELKRKGVWPGSNEEFDKYKKAEIAVWRAATAAGEVYIPKTDPRYSVVKEEGTDGSQDFHFHVMEEVGFPKGVKPFDGGILTDPVVTEDERRRPVVAYQVRNEYQNVFGQWTEENVGLPMAIILNDEFKTAPTIMDRLERSVQITLGDRGSNEAMRKEAEALVTVLETGSLKIRPILEARTVMGATLAGESRDRGILAIIVAFGLVLVFMVIYYRTSGMIANIALLLNLVMLVGFLAFFQAVLTLPGIAGIVLTVGMAVDANILINERIREERRGGRTLRRAVSEGYDRALSAIIDANVTSIITAIFLYKFGSGPVRGFAITLAIGLMVSMFTAIFVTRTVFEGMMKKGIIKDVQAWRTDEPFKVRWLSLRRIFAPISVIAVVVGLFIFSITDRYTLYDIDFTGGYKIQAEFHTETTPDQVKKVLAEMQQEVDVEVPGFDEDNNPIVRKAKVTVGPYPGARVLAVGDQKKSVEIDVQRLFTDPNQDEQEQALAFQKYIRDVLADRLMPDGMIVPPERYDHVTPEDAGGEVDPLEELNGGVRFVVAFRDPGDVLNAGTLEAILKDDMPFWTKSDGREVPSKPADKGLDRKVVVRDYPEESVKAYEVWMKSTTSGGQAVETAKNPNEQKILRTRIAEFLGSKAFTDQLSLGMSPQQAEEAGKVALSQPFPSEDHIGSTVAERLKNDAIIALVLSLIGIIFYIAIRFKSRSMGFAAVICLFHDVAITLGLVAIANSLGIVDAKINLAMVAAFLTLVGYSVNDTVVVFDRIRENRGKRPVLTADIINLSINQTLTRTIRTSLTFLIVCVTLFSFNYGQRNVLEGFAFLLILGSIIGTYSTLAISTPLVLYLPWLWERMKGYAPKGEIVTKTLTNPATILLSPVAAIAWLVWAIAFVVLVFVAGLVLFVPWALSSDDGGKPSNPYARKVETAQA